MIGTTRYIPYRPGIVMMTVSNLNIKGGQSRWISHAGLIFSLSLCWMMICHISTSGSNLNRHAAGILKKYIDFRLIGPGQPRFSLLIIIPFGSFKCIQDDGKAR